MADNDKSGIRFIILGLAFIFLFFGLIFVLYIKVSTQVLPYGNISESLGYPLRSLGIVLIFVGIALAIIAGFLWKMKPSKEMPKSNIKGIKEEP